MDFKKLYSEKFYNLMIYIMSILLVLILWHIGALYTSPLFLPSPYETFSTAYKLIVNKVLFQHIKISLFRILTGWIIGCLGGIPLGILMGRIKTVNSFFTPYIEFFRFIPALSFITLFLIWFGLGEMSKIALIIYNSSFLVTINTMVGSMSVREGSIRAALSLGANRIKLFFRIIVPETIPHIVTGARLALGLSFLTIVGAEMLTAESGIGYLLWSSRTFMLTNQIFVAILTLGFCGFTCNLLFKRIILFFLGKYQVKL